MLDVAVKYHGEDTCCARTNEATTKASFKVYNTGIQVCFTYLGRLPNLFK